MTYSVRIETNADFADVIVAAAQLIDMPVVVSTDLDTGTAVLEVYESQPDEARNREAQLNTLLPVWSDNRYKWTLRTLELTDEDWAEKWKESFHAQQLSPRIVVKPSWEDYTAAPGVHVVELDPGLSFGTGLHPTTRACIRWLDSLADTMRGAAVLDAGCGSGILSIAASMLGYSPVVAFDCDPVAVRCARDNCSKNQIEDVTFNVCELAAYPTGRRFDIVAANILATVLEENAEQLVALLKPDVPVHLLLAGILTTQYDALAPRFQSLGLTETNRITKAEWTSGHFTRD